MRWSCRPQEEAPWGGNHSAAPPHASVITYGANTRSVSQRGVHGIQLRTTMERGDRVRRSLHGVGVVVSVEHQSARADDGSNVNRVGIDVVVCVHQLRLALGCRAG